MFELMYKDINLGFFPSCHAAKAFLFQYMEKSGYKFWQEITHYRRKDFIFFKNNTYYNLTIIKI